MKKTEYLFDNAMLNGDTSDTGVTVLSEGQILEQYFDHWIERIYKAAKNKDSNAYQILKERLAEACVEDFVVVHFGWEKQ
jgi:hypothetical protein